MPPKKIDRTAYFAAYYKKKVEKIGRKKMRSDNLKSKQKNRIKNNKTKKKVTKQEPKGGVWKKETEEVEDFFVFQLKDGKISEIIIDPKTLNVNAEKFENLIGDDANFNADKMIEIFKGKDNDFSKAVCLNAAAGLIVGEKFTEFSDAYKFAREFILTGKPYSHLEKIQNV